LDRDDIFELAERLDNVTDAIGDMVFLHGISQPLDPVTEQAPSWSGRPSTPARACAAWTSSTPTASAPT
jgi:hypothetical protein